jgi:hypothetical protein
MLSRAGTTDKLFIFFQHFKNLNKGYFDNIVLNDHVIEVWDCSGYFFFMGIEGKSTTFVETVNIFKSYIKDNNINRVFLFGFCRGSFLSMMFGSFFPGSHIFAVEPIFSIEQEMNEIVDDGRFLGKIENDLRRYGLERNPDFMNKLNVFSHFNKSCHYYVFYTSCGQCEKQIKLAKTHNFCDNNNVHIVHYENEIIHEKSQLCDKQILEIINNINYVNNIEQIISVNE